MFQNNDQPPSHIDPTREILNRRSRGGCKGAFFLCQNLGFITLPIFVVFASHVNQSLPLWPSFFAAAFRLKNRDLFWYCRQLTLHLSSSTGVHQEGKKDRTTRTFLLVAMWILCPFTANVNPFPWAGTLQPESFYIPLACSQPA